MIDEPAVRPAGFVSRAEAERNVLRIKPSSASAATDCFSRFACDDLVLVAAIPTDLPWLKDVGATGSNTLALAGIVDCLPSAADRRQLHLLVSLGSD